jgi:hypothetical protein
MAELLEDQKGTPGGAGNPKSKIRNKFKKMEISKMERAVLGNFSAVCEQFGLLP